VNQPTHDISLNESVLAVLAWFDVFGYPLTLVEVVRFARLTGGRELIGSRVKEELESDHRIVQFNGYYFLVGSEAIVKLRRRRFRLATRKLKKARCAARLFGLLPSVRLVGVCNSLAFSSADDNSDIDLFVVCRPGTIWTTRLFLTGALTLLGLRPTPKVQRDRLCPSFFVTETALDLSSHALSDGDPYLKFWICTLLPLYDAGGVYEHFLAANSWIFGPTNVVAVDNVQSKIQMGVFERTARQFQRCKFPSQIKDMANRDSRVVISDEVLKFHIIDRRANFRDEYHHRLTNLGISICD